MADLRTRTAASMFQPVPGGYLFREPFRRAARSPHYLVNEAQKAQIIEILIPRRIILAQVVMWTALCAMVAIASLATWLLTGHDNPTGMDTVWIVGLTAVQMILGFAIVRWWKLRQLRPLLATLPPSDQRISNSAMRAASIAAMSGRQLAFVVGANAFAAAAMLFNAAIHRHEPFGIFWLVLGLIFAGLAVYYFRNLRRRREVAGTT